MKMEFSLSSYDGALPVEVTIDDDNGRYTIRKSDRSGEFVTASVVSRKFTAFLFRGSELQLRHKPLRIKGASAPEADALVADIPGTQH